MKAAVFLSVSIVLGSAAARAEVVDCLPGMPGMAGAGVKFEVWPDSLPAPDYLDGYEACLASWLTSPPTRPSQSAWRESQRRTFTDALKKQRVDILVAPFQNQGYGLERTERALMSADLAYHLDPALRVADPFLTARALGEGERRYSPRDIVDLARAVGARRAVVGYVGHDRRHRMTVTLQVLDIEGSQDGDAPRSLVQQDWRSVPFTHVDPPFAVFHRMLPSVLESLALPAGARNGESRLTFPDDLSFALADVASVDRPVGASLGLSLLGALSAATGELSRERLFERALVSSWHFDAPGADTAFLRAYALLNLEHRPAALALINGSPGPEFAGLRALLNGNLPEAAEALAEVRNPLKRLMLAVHVDDMRFEYQREDLPVATDAEAWFDETAAEWLALAVSRSNDGSMWRVDQAAILKYLLDQAYPVSGLDVQSVLGGSLVIGARVDDVSVDVATMRHVRRFVENNEVPVCCSAETARATTWDLVSLVEGRTEQRLGKYLYLTTVVRAAPETAGEAIERYRAVFDGHPLFALAQADHALAVAEESADGETVQRLRQEARDHAHRVVAWSGGQSDVAHSALMRLGTPGSQGDRYADAYGFDYPRRSHWFTVFTRFRDPYGDPEAVKLREELRVDALPYARTDFDAVGSIRSESDKVRLQSEIQSRFMGHPARAEWVKLLRPPRPSLGDPILDLKAALEEDPSDWNIRQRLGRMLIEERGQWKEAADVLIARPEFHNDHPPQIVNVSNDAYDIGTLFYWGGQEDLAVPFYEVAASLQTGAGSQMTSQIRLDILANRYQAAAGGSYARAQRYPAAYPFRDFLSFLHALGFGQEAWDGFSQVAAAFDNPQIWVSALVGQRIEGKTEPEIRAWLKQPGIRDARFRNNSFAPRYAVLVNASDHDTPEDLGELVAELEGEPAGVVVSPGVHERPHPESMSDTHLVARSAYAAGMPAAPNGTRVRSEFAYFGAAYAALRHGRFGDAVEAFKTMAGYYPIETQEYGFALPYFAWAAAKTGDEAGVEQFLNSVTYHPPVFDLNLARAFFHGARKETQQARELLDKALRVHPFTEHRPILIEYQWAEACEWLYQETGDEGFVEALLAWVISQQRVQPTHAWPYAMEYTYARDPERKRRALAMTLYLDPASPRIRGASAKERAEAEAWGAANNPFLREDDPAEAGGPTARVSAQPLTTG